MPSPRTSVTGTRAYVGITARSPARDAHGVERRGVGRDHRADALGREQLEDERVLDPTVHQVHTPDARAQGAHGALDLRDHPALHHAAAARADRGTATPRAPTAGRRPARSDPGRRSGTRASRRRARSPARSPRRRRSRCRPGRTRPPRSTRPPARNAAREQRVSTCVVGRGRPRPRTPGRGPTASRASSSRPSTPERPTASTPPGHQRRDDLGVELAGEHHRRDVERLGVGHPQPVDERRLDAEARRHLGSPPARHRARPPTWMPRRCSSEMSSANEEASPACVHRGAAVLHDDRPCRGARA